MKEKDYLQDISVIKNMMSKSTRFISLSGISGVLAGIYALIGAYFAYNILIAFVATNNRSTYNAEMDFALNIIQFKLLAIAFLVAFLSIISAYILSKQKAKKQGVKIWDATTKRLLYNFLIPLVTGGFFSLTLLNQGFYGFIAPVTLIFYGLALVNASKYTIGNIKYLGFAEIILGLIAMNYIGFGIKFWAVGFGVFHIVYGALMYFMLERNK